MFDQDNIDQTKTAIANDLAKQFRNQAGRDLSELLQVAGMPDVTAGIIMSGCMAVAGKLAACSTITEAQYLDLCLEALRHYQEAFKDQIAKAKADLSRQAGAAAH